MSKFWIAGCTFNSSISFNKYIWHHSFTKNNWMCIFFWLDESSFMATCEKGVQNLSHKFQSKSYIFTAIRGYASRAIYLGNETSTRINTVLNVSEVIKSSSWSLDWRNLSYPDAKANPNFWSKHAWLFTSTPTNH